MMQSDYVNWGAALLLSLLLHGFIFMQHGAQIGAENAPALQSPLVTRLNFKMFEDRPVPEAPPPLEKPEPKPVKKVKPLPKPVKPVARPPEPQPKPEPVIQPVAQPQVQGQQVAQVSDGLLKRKRELYLHQLLSHIESHKFYPRAARRRALEGNVKIAFVLRDDGYYEQLELNGRRKILLNATRQALEAARPLPVPPSEIGLDRHIEFNMVYSLAD